jgi:hypothetical protein
MKPDCQGKIKVQRYDRMEDVPATAWDTWARQGSITQSRAFWQVLEQAELNDFRYHYLVFFAPSGEAIGISSVYQVTTDIAIFADGRLRDLLQWIRGRFPGFLKWRMLECGTPITITSPPWYGQGEELLPCLLQTLRQWARQEGQLLIILRDFEPEQFFHRQVLVEQGYHWIDSLPNTYLDLPWGDASEYLQAMRSYFRSKVRKTLRRNQTAGVHYVRTGDFAHLADQLFAQWLTVHEHAKEYQREVLTPAFYRHFAQMGDAAQVILFYRDDVLVAHALLLQDGELLRWLYVGRSEASNDGLYLYIAYAVVAEALAMGVRQLEMGLTTYDIKLDLGATITPIKMALRARWGWMNPFVGLGYRVLNQVPKPQPRPVFKEGKGARNGARSG